MFNLLHVVMVTVVIEPKRKHVSVGRKRKQLNKLDVMIILTYIETVVENFIVLSRQLHQY